MDNSLSFQDLQFAYPDSPDNAVAGISGAIEPGTLTSIIGPNGAGKSTLLRLLNGLELPNNGSIQIGPRSLTDLDHKERARQIAFVPQALDRIPEVHVDDFVLGGRYAHQTGWARRSSADREAVAGALKACDAIGLENRLLHSLSGGQRQRVLIARALAQAAQIMLVDEPTASLDPGHKLTIFELLASLAAQGKTILVVTHDLNLASQFSDQICLIHEGRITAQGTPAEVLTPGILTPIYGPALTFGSHPTPAGPRPFVLSWRAESTD